MLESRNTIRALRAAASAIALTAMTAGGVMLATGPANAQAAIDNEAVYNALMEARALAEARNLQGALAKVDEAAAVPNKTPNDTLLVEQTRLAFLTAAQNWGRAATSAQAIIDTGGVPAAEVQRLRQQIATFRYQAGNRDAARQAAEAYIDQYGATMDMHLLLARIGIDTQNHQLAIRHARAAIAAARGRPDENLLRTLYSAGAQQNDFGVQFEALGLLVTHYPKAEYWQSMIATARREPGFDTRGLGVDVYRLMIAAELPLTGEQRISMAEEIMIDGWPNEAARVLQAGFAAGDLGQGAEAARHQRLLERAQSDAARFREERATTEAEAQASSNGELLVIVGQNYLDNEDYARAAELISAGLERGGVSREQTARLHLGIAQMRSGQDAAARQTFSSIRGGAGAERLANIWLRLHNGG